MQTRLRLKHAPVCADNVHFITEASLMLLYDTITSRTDHTCISIHFCTIANSEYLAYIFTANHTLIYSFYPSICIVGYVYLYFHII